MTTDQPDQPTPADHLRTAALHLLAALPDAALTEARDRLVELWVSSHRPPAAPAASGQKRR